MSRKITKEEFLRRFYNNFNDAEVEVIEYHSIKKPCVLKCKKCGKEFKKDRAEFFIRKWDCCGENKISLIEKVEEIFRNDGSEFIVVKQAKDKRKWIIKHKVCGNEFERTAQAIFRNSKGCPFCNTISKHQQLSLEEVQKQLDEKFNYKIRILSFNGVDYKSKFRCEQCGLIFEQKHYNLITKTRGCPKCMKRKSKGEQAMISLLEKREIIYKEQVRFLELGSLSFDFVLYNSNNEIIGIVEIQGEQHFEENHFFKRDENSFKRQQEYDNIKRDFCKNNNYPFYEIPNKNGKLINIDILPF